MTPRTLSELRERLLEDVDPLSPRLREVRQYVLERPQSIALDTLSVIAEKADLPPSTLVRFAREYGFDGFSALQKLYKSHLHRHYADYATRIRQLRDERAEPGAGEPLAFLHDLVDAQRDALAHLAATIDGARLEQALCLLDEAPSVHVLGVRRAFPVTTWLLYALGRLGVRCHAIDGVGLMHEEQLNAARSGDLLFCVTYSPYAHSVRELVATAREKSVRILLLTDDPEAPSARHADCVLVVHDAETGDFRSLDASLCVAQALCLALGYRRSDSGTPLEPPGPAT